MKTDPTCCGLIRENLVTFTLGQRGCTLLVFQGFNYVRNRSSGLKTYWICAKKGSTKCNARVVTDVVDGVQKIVLESCHHNHTQRVARKKRSSARVEKSAFTSTSTATRHNVATATKNTKSFRNCMKSEHLIIDEEQPPPSQCHNVAATLSRQSPHPSSSSIIRVKAFTDVMDATDLSSLESILRKSV